MPEKDLAIGKKLEKNPKATKKLLDEPKLRHHVKLELTCAKLLLKTHFPKGVEQTGLPGKDGDSYTWDIPRYCGEPG